MAEITKCQQKKKKKNSFYTSVWNTHLSCACVSKHHLIRLIFPENTTIRVTKATSTRSTSHNCKERKAVLMTKKPKWRMPCHEKKCSFQYLCCNISHQAITYLQRSHSLCLKSTTLNSLGRLTAKHLCLFSRHFSIETTAPLDRKDNFFLL